MKRRSLSANLVEGKYSGTKGGFTGTIGQLLSFLSMSTHFDSISRGVIDSRDLFYFLSITFLGLMLAETSLSKRNIVE